jgi:uncharacterized protein YjbJ (UPF0337 family)
MAAHLRRKAKERPMNWDIIKGNWSQFKGEVQSRWGKLTDDEVDQAEGESEKLVGLLQERYGMAKAEAEAELDKMVRNFKESA